jgi:hypothetical protein
MNFIALIFAVGFSLFHLSDTYVIESFEKETREVFVSHYSLAKQQLSHAVDSQPLIIKAKESLYFLHYDYVPVTKYLFIKIRILLL